MNFFYVKDENTIYGLSMVLSQNPMNLLEIEIVDKKISAKDLSVLASGIKSNERIQRLILNSNFIDDQGAIVISKFLSENRSLKDVELSNNKCEKKISLKKSKFGFPYE